MHLKANVIGLTVLAMPVLVDSQIGFQRFDLAAQDLIPSLRDDQANDLIDRLCGQVDGNGAVSGAINIQTGDFMTWAEYRAGPGNDGNPDYNYAVGQWETFWGSCSLAALSTWSQNGPITTGNLEFNVRWDNALAVARTLPINIYLPGFHCRMTLPSLYPRIASPFDCAVEFGELPGLPEWVTTPLQWWGYTRTQDTYLSLDDPPGGLIIPPCHSADCTATTAMRVVRAVRVFHVHQYSWNNARGISANVDSWQDWGREDHWDFIYSSAGYIDGLGLTLMRPGDYGYVNVQCNEYLLRDVNQCY
jgi:hypothetical protein